MGIRKNHNLIADNSGFSLVEVIVSLLIMVIIVAPTYMIFTSAMKSTTVANKEMYAQNVADKVLAEVKYKGTAISSTGSQLKRISSNADAAAGKYVFKNDSSDPFLEGDQEYDVTVEMTAEPYSAVGGLAANSKKGNEYKFGDMSEISADSTLVINPSQGATSVADTCDGKAIEAFTSAYTGPGTVTEANIRGSHVSRELNINLYYDDVNDELTLSYNLVYIDLSGKFSMPTYIESATIIKPGIKTVYFFYSPWNPQDDGIVSGVQNIKLLSSKEKVTITAQSLQTAHAIDFYLVPQCNAGEEFSATSQVSVDYNAYSCQSNSLNFYSSVTTVGTMLNANGDRNKTSILLNAEETENRIYSVTITVVDRTTGKTFAKVNTSITN